MWLIYTYQMLVNKLMNADTLGYIAAFLTTIAFLPQLLKTLRTKSADDVSLLMLILFLTGVFCWIIYGWFIKSIPILIANSLTFSLNMLILILKLSYQKEIFNSNKSN
tara:strand:- start:49 stop:372 length:324 start_codon:yes stop_codon:yes gene_type:complete